MDSALIFQLLKKFLADSNNKYTPIYLICDLVGFCWICATIRCLNKIFSLRHQEARITISQIVLLLSFCIGIALMLYILDIKKDTIDYYVLAAVGAVSLLVFQNTLRSVVAFFYLRSNGLLRIGDWIEVPSHNINGMVRMITLTSVTIENWDTTSSTFPTYLLHAEHFRNNQKMLQGRTLGRRMLKTFTLDSGWIRTLDADDVRRLCAMPELDSNFCRSQFKPGMLNMEAFRLYIYHWLMTHPKVSQHPRLVVRWLEHTSEGLPLQLYVFLTDTGIMPFEWQQSLIIEHFVKALSWFGLQLYQKPAGYDAINNNIHIMQQEADHVTHHVR